MALVGDAMSPAIHSYFTGAWDKRYFMPTTPRPEAKVGNGS